MTREVRYLDSTRQRFDLIDHGHCARKAVLCAAVALVAPFALLRILLAAAAWCLEALLDAVSRLDVWAHPCLYRSEEKEGSDAPQP